MTKTFLAHITEMANKKLAAMEEEIVRQQAEMNRLRDLLKQCIPAAEFAKDKGLADMINKALNGESEGKMTIEIGNNLAAMIFVFGLAFLLIRIFKG